MKVTDIIFRTPTGGYRYNIEVEDTHNYLANGKLVSNCHHTPATTFKNIVDKSRAKYKIGLSATLKRKDGKHVLLQDYIGGKTYIPPKENTVDPVVIVKQMNIKIPGTTKMPWALRMNRVYENPAYVKEIVGMACTQAGRGHTVLVVADRIEFLENCQAITPQSVVITSRTPNQKEEEGKILSGEAKILYGSKQIYTEGVSINVLSSLIIASAINNEYLLEQLAGRINRLKESGIQPELVDMAFDGRTGKNQLSTRVGFYTQEGWKIVYV